MSSKHVYWILHNYPPVVLGGAEFTTHRLNVWLRARGWSVTVYIIPGGLRPLNDYPAEYEGVPIVPCSNPYSLVIPPGTRVCSQLWATRAAHMLAEMRGVLADYIEFVHYVDHTVVSPWPWTTRRDFTMVYNSEDTRRRALEIGGWLRDVRGLVCPPVVWPLGGAPRTTAEDYPWITLVNFSEDKGALQFNAIAAHDETGRREYTALRGAHGTQCTPHARVQCHEATLDMEAIWAKTRILVVPSAYETWSMVATEAMARGIPVVAADHIPALRENCGDAAIYVPRDAPAAWLAAFDTIEAEYAARSAAALARVRDPTEPLTAVFS